MRLQVITKDGLVYDDHRYAQGEEFEIEDTARGRVWSAVLLSRNVVKRAEPVVLGTEPPAPKPPPVPPAPQSTEVRPITTQDVPNAATIPQENAGPAEPGEAWMQPPWSEEQAAAPSAEEDGTTRRGRTRRRDLRAEE